MQLKPDSREKPLLEVHTHAHKQTSNTMGAPADDMLGTPTEKHIPSAADKSETATEDPMDPATENIVRAIEGVVVICKTALLSYISITISRGGKGSSIIPWVEPLEDFAFEDVSFTEAVLQVVVRICLFAMAFYKGGSDWEHDVRVADDLDPALSRSDKNRVRMGFVGLVALPFFTPSWVLAEYPWTSVFGLACWEQVLLRFGNRERWAWGFLRWPARLGALKEELIPRFSRIFWVSC